MFVSILVLGMAFIAGSDDGTCNLFDIRSYSQLHKIQSDTVKHAVTSTDLSSTGRFLVAGYDDCQGKKRLLSRPCSTLKGLSPTHFFIFLL